MGRCLAFNFGPEELKQKLKDVRYFVYCPDFDGVGGGFDQHFYTLIDTSSVPSEQIIENLSVTLGLKLVKQISERDSLYSLGGNSRVRFFIHQREPELFIEMTSCQDHGAITDDQIAVVRLFDKQLQHMQLKPRKITKHQDVIFGTNHLLANDLSKPFTNRSTHVPTQNKWHVGRSYKEALENFNASFKT